jgi:hypothetical protein
METANLKAAKVYEAAQNEASEQLALAEKAAADAVYQWWIASTLEKLARTATTEAVDSNSEQQQKKRQRKKKKQQQPKEAPLVTILKQLLKRAQRLLTTTEQEISGLKKRQAQYAAKELASNPIRRCYSTDLPSVRSGAYQALMNNFASNVAKLKKNGVGHFDLHYMTLKDRQTSFEIAWQNWQSNSETCVWTKLRNPGLWRVDRFRPPDDSDSKGQRRKQQRKTRTLPDANSLAYAHHDPRLLLLTRDGEFYVVLRYKVKTNKRASETQARALRVVILDLGTRRVASALDLGKERLVNLGDGAATRLERLLRQRDRLALLCRSDLEETCAPAVFAAAYSEFLKGLKPGRKPKKLDHHRRCNMKRALAKLDRKIRNLVDSLQIDICKWLCTNFDVVLLPHFGTKDMIRKCGRKIGKRTARMLQTLAFGRFEERLKAMAQRHGCKVVICTEEYTSKTCPCCGHINRDLGGSLLFCCEKCAFTADRDLVGALNIFIKYATEHAPQALQALQAITAQAPPGNSVGVPTGGNEAVTQP